MIRNSITILTLIAAAALVFADDDEEAKQLPDGPGKDAVAAVCFSCHGSGNFRKLRLTKEGWSQQVNDMMDRGAEATDAQVTAVVNYLTLTFGEGAKIYINTAPYEELKAILGLSVAETQAVLGYRTEKGAFKSWEDLQKVRGVDQAKLEKKKELIVF